MDGRDKFLLNDLPPIDAFYSSLSEETITLGEYERAQTVWREFNIENMQQYHDLYMNLDVLLLAEVLKIFVKRASWTTASTPLIIKLYQALHSMRVSNLLNRNWICLPTVKSSFFENSIRGGIIVVSHRHVKAYNPLVPDYDHNSPDSYPLIWMLITFMLERWAKSCQ